MSQQAWDVMPKTLFTSCNARDVITALEINMKQLFQDIHIDSIMTFLRQIFFYKI